MSDCPKEPCEICQELFDPIEDLIWVNRSLTVALCDNCYDTLHTDKLCPRCGHDLFKETKDTDYPYVCLDCYENFYGFEVVERKS